LAGKTDQGVDLMIVGQDYLRHQIAPPIPPGPAHEHMKIFLIPSALGRGLFSLWGVGRDFVKTPYQFRNSLAEIAKLLRNSLERMKRYVF